MNKNSIANLFYRILTALVLLALILGIVPSQSVRAATVRYVKPDGKTSGECGSWANACELQYALGLAVSGDELWVKQGTYKPTNGSDRNATFHLITGVGLYGGFDGTEANRGDRKWLINKTILSGDIGVSGDNSDNSYNVVIGSGADSSAVLDGFTITGGNANGGDGNGGGMVNISGSPSLANIVFDSNTALYRGGGMYNHPGNSSLTNITFINNSSGFYGGGLFNYNSTISLVNVTFIGNTTGFYGGGMHSNFSNLSLTNVTFDGNTSGYYGGGMVAAEFDLGVLANGIIDGNPPADLNGAGSIDLVNIILVNVTFIDNIAGWFGGGMYNIYTSPTLANVTFNGNTAIWGGGIYNNSSNPNLHNSILWDNNPDQIYNDGNSNTTITYSDLQGECPARSICTTGVIYSNPQFINPATGDVRLSGTSPAIDAGDNTQVPLGTLYDLAGNPRFIDIPEINDTGNGVPPIVDMGAYEHQAPITVSDSYTTNEDVQLFVSAPGVLSNDIDLNGDSLTAVLNVSPSHGTLTLYDNGSFRYNPDAGYFGTDSFTYHANDGELNSNIATVTITVSHTVSGTTTTVNCGSGSPEVSYGSSITCIATVTRAAGNHTPGGMVSWTTNGSGSFGTSPCTLSGSGSTATCSVSYTPSAVGSGSHLITATYGGDTNFNTSNGNQTLTVFRHLASVTPNSANKTYGAVDPTLTGTLAGFLTSDNVTPVYSRTPGETVYGSPYTINAVLSPAGVLSNYNITYNTGNFTITQRPITVTADAKSKVVGQLDPVLTYRITSGNLAFSDAFTGFLTRVAGESAGKYAILQGSLSLSTNYTLTYIGADLTISNQLIYLPMINK